MRGEGECERREGRGVRGERGECERREGRERGRGGSVRGGRGEG